MQLYWQITREATLAFAQRAADAGYKALVLTVDAPVNGIRDAEVEAGHDVGGGHAVGVVTVERQLIGVVFGQQRGEDGFDLAWRAATYGVTQADFVAAHIEQGADHRQHLRRGDFAFVGAGDQAADVAAYADVGGQCLFCYRLEAGQALFDGAVDVFLTEGLTGGPENGDIFRAGGPGGFPAFQVRDQYRVALDIV